MRARARGATVAYPAEGAPSSPFFVRIAVGNSRIRVGYAPHTVPKIERKSPPWIANFNPRFPRNPVGRFCKSLQGRRSYFEQLVAPRMLKKETLHHRGEQI
jgi:hypothetical protein